jgi:hypothetical protein
MIARNFEIYGAETGADLELLKSLGFTQVILDDQGLANLAGEFGLAVVLANWWNTSTTWTQIQALFEYALGLNNLVSINMMDEPIYNGVATHPPELYMRIRETMRSQGFDQRLSLTIYGPQSSWPVSWSRLFMEYLATIDILRIDPYAIAAGQPLRIVKEWIDYSHSLMAVAQRELPLTVVVQAWNSGSGLPSIAEIRVMAYMALFSGVETVSFYSYNPTVWNQTKGFLRGFAAIMTELTALSREFENADIQPVLGGDDLFQVEICHEGQWTCITVNTRNHPNGVLGPLEIVRSNGRCPMPMLVNAFVGEFAPPRQRLL